MSALSPKKHGVTTTLRRLYSILRVAQRYNLLSLIPRSSLPLLLKVGISFLALFSSKDQRPAEQRIRLAIEELGPVYVKFGQLLSTRRDMLPDALAVELAKLQDNVPPFSNEIAVAIIEKSLGKPLLNVFRSVESEPLASASVAQVYKAEMEGGKSVVIKVLRPGIEKLIALDMGMMKHLATLMDRYSTEAKRLHLPEVVRDYKNTIEAELDLKQEAANTSLLRRNFVENEKYQHLLLVPEVYWDLCSERVLVADYVDGFPISDAASIAKHSVDRQRLAERGVEIFFTQVFEHNFFHADMHPGNIFVDVSNAANPRYVALDCAIMGSLSDDDRSFVARILLSALNRDYEAVATLCLNANWIAKDTNLTAFTSVIRSVCEPIFSKPLSEISFGTLLLYLFQAARRFGMDIQPSLVLLQKTLINIEGLGRDLYPDLDLWSTAQPFLQQWVDQSKAPNEVLKRFAVKLGNSAFQIDNLLSMRSGADAHALESLRETTDKLERRLSRQKRLLAAAAVIAVIYQLVF